MGLPTIMGTARIIGDIRTGVASTGKAWLSTTLAFNSKRQDESGRWVDADQFVARAAAFGSLAENMAGSVAKGDEVYVVGMLKDTKWTGKDSVERTRPELVIETAALSMRWGTVTAARRPKAGSAPSVDPWESATPIGTR
jgi:single-strand DNA-binding protein